MFASEEWARGSQVLSPEELLGKLTLVQMEEDVLGVIQLGHRGDGTSCNCPVEELALGGDV